MAKSREDSVVGSELERVAPEYRRRIEAAGLGRRDTHIRFDATEQERAAIARQLGLVSLDALEGAVTVRPWSAGLRLEGLLRAEVVQTCVVTLDPVAATVEQAFERRYLPEERLSRERAGGGAAAAIDLDVDAEEEPEPLVGGGIELGDVVVEELALALDPFPRCPEARLETPEPDEQATLRPFAALAKLKR